MFGNVLFCVFFAILVYKWCYCVKVIKETLKRKYAVDVFDLAGEPQAKKPRVQELQVMRVMPYVNQEQSIEQEIEQDENIIFDSDDDSIFDYLSETTMDAVEYFNRDSRAHSRVGESNEQGETIDLDSDDDPVSAYLSRTTMNAVEYFNRDPRAHSRVGEPIYSSSDSSDMGEYNVESPFSMSELSQSSESQASSVTLEFNEENLAAVLREESAAVSRERPVYTPYPFHSESKLLCLRIFYAYK